MSASQEALAALDQKVLSKMKRLNAFKHTTHTYQQRLKDLKTECQRLKPQGCRGVQSADARAQKKEEDAMVFTSWCVQIAQKVQHFRVPCDKKNTQLKISIN